jgi:uncharacterized phage protein (TIGR02218 family)
VSKTLSAGMEAHVAAPVQTLHWALKFTRTDGQVFRYCTSRRAKTLDGEVYQPAPGFDLSSMTCTLGYEVDTLNLTVLTDSDLEHADFLAGRWYGARVEFNQYNWADPSQGFIPWPTYKVADVQRVIGGFLLELRDLRQLLRQDYTLTTGKLCENRLGDARCQVDVAGEFTYSFTVTSVTSRLVFTDSALGLDANWCIGGLVTFDDGLYEGLPLLVREQSAGGQITLAEGDRLVTPIDVGQTGTITAGCRKRLNLDCRDKFDNVINFLGAKHSPSDNDLAGGASV